ncbi:MAG: N-acetylmuramic acid 6-phosphate etherase [Dictyoglomus sp. NZ13-RE01]|nr:MAG: N-acetylmuramic acid 6-phosphate etherase [Dictyoglomus sp. NZ13-RE01]
MSEILTESINPNSRNIDEKSTEEILRIINEEDKKVPLAVEKEIPKIAEVVDEIVKRIEKGGRVFYVGAGTSGRLGVLDASEIPPTYGADPNLFQGIIAGGDFALRFSVEGIEDDEERGRRDLEEKGINEKDTVIGIAASGKTPYVLSALKFAKEKGAFTVGIVCNENTPMEKICDKTIKALVGPEVIAGSTRMKAGTAQKLILNMISTSVMIKLGKVYDNLMVDVQVLNKKLKERAKRILNITCNLGEKEAEEILKKANNNVKLAIIMAKSGVDYNTAKNLLEKHKGRIRDVLKEIGG